MAVTATLTLGDLAAVLAAAIRILEQYGLDYCCGGKGSVEDACLAKGIDPCLVLQEMEAAAASATADHDWQTVPLDELVIHVGETHHSCLKVHLPVLEARIARVAAVYGPRDPEMWLRL